MNCYNAEYVEPTNNTPATLAVHLTTARRHVEHVTATTSYSTSGRPFHRRSTSGDVIRFITLHTGVVVNGGKFLSRDFNSLNETRYIIPPIASVFRITYVASRGVNYPPAVSQVLCQLETRFQRFSFANFSVIPTPAASGTSSLVNTRWRTETGSSYKLVTGRDISVMSAATTQFSVMPDPLPQVPTSTDFGEKHQVQIGS